MAGFLVGAERNELDVDNFSAVFFFNDFSAQTQKFLESWVFDHFQSLRKLDLTFDHFSLKIQSIVDNFFGENIFIDFNTQSPKFLESYVFIYFPPVHALIECSISACFNQPYKR